MARQQASRSLPLVRRPQIGNPAVFPHVAAGRAGAVLVSIHGDEMESELPRSAAMRVFETRAARRRHDRLVEGDVGFGVPGPILRRCGGFQALDLTRQSIALLLRQPEPPYHFRLDHDPHEEDVADLLIRQSRDRSSPVGFMMDEPLVHELAEGIADGRPAGTVASRQVGFGKRCAGNQLTLQNPAAEPVGQLFPNGTSFERLGHRQDSSRVKPRKPVDSQLYDNLTNCAKEVGVGSKRRGIASLAAILVASAPASAQQLTPEQLESVRRGAASVHVPDSGVVVPLIGRPDIPMVDVELNGRGPYRFLLDLGSNVVIVRRDVADDAGLYLVLEREGADVMTAHEMTIGDARFRDVWLGAYDELDVDGVVGYNILRGTGIVLDYPARRLRLGPLHLPAAGSDGVLAYDVHGRMPYVRGRIGERDVLLNFDTGASNYIVFPAFMADSLPLDGTPVPGPVLFNNQTGSIRVLVGRLSEDLIVGTHVIERPAVLFDPDVEDAWLGSAILADARLELDTKRLVLRLRSDSPLAASAWRTLGLRLGPYDPSSATRPVTDVIPGSPADDVPITVGDSVVSIADVPAAELVSWRRHRLAEENTVVEVLLRRGGGYETVQLTVAALP